MTDLLDRAVDHAMASPPEMQGAVDLMILSCADDEGQSVPVTPDGRAAIERSLDAATRGDFATEAEI